MAITNIYHCMSYGSIPNLSLALKNAFPFFKEFAFTSDGNIVIRFNNASMPIFIDPIQWESNRNNILIFTIKDDLICYRFEKPHLKKKSK